MTFVGLVLSYENRISRYGLTIVTESVRIVVESPVHLMTRQYVCI